MYLDIENNMKIPLIDSLTISKDNYIAVNKILSQHEIYPNNLEIKLSDNVISKSSVLFNVLPNKDVKEDIIIKKYILEKRYIEAIFDRKYQSKMRQSPDHLIFLSSFVQLQKLIYVYLCYEFGLSINLEGDEKIKIWPTNLNIHIIVHIEILYILRTRYTVSLPVTCSHIPA